MVEVEGFLRMIDRIEYLAQLGRLRMSVPALARQVGLSVNTVRGFLNGKDIRLSCFLAITEALGGNVSITFAKVTERGLEDPQSLPLNMQVTIAKHARNEYTNHPTQPPG